MLKILRLEFLFSRRQLFIVLAVFTAYFAYMAAKIDSPRAFIVMTSLMIGLSIPFAILGREDKFKTSALVCSLPVSRSTVVLGKYVATWAAIGLGLAYAIAVTAVLPFTKFRVAEVLTGRALLVSLFLISIIFAVILPFTLRFGLTGVIILLVSGQLLGILALVLTSALGGGRNSSLRAVFGTAERALRSLLHHEATAGFVLALLGGILAVGAVSLLISQALYARREF